MRKFNTANLTEQAMRTMNADEVSWIYNGLDCCVTYEIRDVLKEELHDSPQNVQDTYEFAMQKHGAILDMSLRGLKIDNIRLKQTIRELTQELSYIENNFNVILKEVFDIEDFNWRSPKQVSDLLYRVMQLKPIRKRNTKGQYVPSTGRDALEKLSQYFYAQPICSHILAMRDLGKSIGFLKSEQDDDGRMRTSFNIAGTNTGRLASSENEFGSGTNLQNVAKKLRYPFIADTRKILVNVDLEQADARNVGATIYNIFYETQGPEKAGKYLDACESGDLHTTVCRMAWPHLAWHEDRAHWRETADIKAYREMSYRDLAKRLGHGTNYYGQPRTMAVHTKTQKALIEEFQKAYFLAFPLIPEWHKWVKNELQMVGQLTTLFGRRRHFFKRMDDPATLREAIAYGPQSMTAHQIDKGLVQLWRADPVFELLVQVHDSIMFQVPWKDHEELIPRALELLKVTLELKGGRQFHVPLEAECGWNWGPYDKATNKYGLRGWTGVEKRNPPQRSLKRNSIRDYL